MSRWRTDAETVQKRALIGAYHPAFDGVAHALAVLSRADTTPVPEEARTDA
jgi:hypothetical protein